MMLTGARSGLMMTIDKMIEVLDAFKAGKPIQYRFIEPNSQWRDITNPGWNFEFSEYRVKPEPREWWINCYPYPTVDSVYSERYPTKILADAASLPSRTECVHVREVL